MREDAALGAFVDLEDQVDALLRQLDDLAASPSAEMRPERR